jgi:hypothetical protein
MAENIFHFGRCPQTRPPLLVKKDRLRRPGSDITTVTREEKTAFQLLLRRRATTVASISQSGPTARAES